MSGKKVRQLFSQEVRTSIQKQTEAYKTELGSLITPYTFCAYLYILCAGWNILFSAGTFYVQPEHLMFSLEIKCSAAHILCSSLNILCPAWKSYFRAGNLLCQPEHFIGGLEQFISGGNKACARPELFFPAGKSFSQRGNKLNRRVCKLNAPV